MESNWRHDKYIPRNSPIEYPVEHSVGADVEKRVRDSGTRVILQGNSKTQIMGSRRPKPIGALLPSERAACGALGRLRIGKQIGEITGRKQERGAVRDTGCA